MRNTQIILRNEAIESLRRGIWATLGLYIVQTQESGTWSETASSFTQWVKNLAADLQISLARCWRYRSAVLFYRRLREKNPQLPEIQELPNKVSPESLELLEKLTHVAPTDVIRKLQAQVLANEITVREMKLAWQTYGAQVASQGKRGRGVTQPPILKTVNPVEKNCLHGLYSDKRWTGSEYPVLFVMHANVEYKNLGREYDAVAQVQLHKSDPLDIHVFDVKIDHGINYPLKFPELVSDGVDYVWIVSPEITENIRNSAYAFYGLIEADAKHADIIRRAKRLRDPRATTLERELLLVALKR